MRTRPRSRGQLRNRTVGASLRQYAAVSIAVAVFVVAAVYGISMLSGRSAADGSSATAAPAASSEGAASTPATTGVEVPSVVGLSMDEARVVLDAAGLGYQSRAQDATATGSALVVVDQDPVSGVLALAGRSVVLTVREGSAAVRSLGTSGDNASKKRVRGVVCIDPGHQAFADITPEPIGPKSKKTKHRVTGGATGVATRIPEYELTLQISTNLKRQLEERGIEVVMTRTTSDVNISNSERAKIANKAKADLFVRVHCDGSPDSEAAGISTLYPGKNRWTKPIARRSRTAALLVQESVVDATGAIDRGVTPRTNLSGFNWAKVPSVLVECGFLSNPVEDRLLASPHYQDKLARGIADGVVDFLEEDL